MRTNGAGLPAKRRGRPRQPIRRSIDISTQTENFLIEENISNLPVVILDKSTITKYIQMNRNQDPEEPNENGEISSRNIGKAITTTNYSTFLKPINNNQYANSTFENQRETQSSAPVIRKKFKRKVKFFRPNMRRQSGIEYDRLQDRTLSPTRDASCSSERLEPIAERTEMNQTVSEIEEDEEAANEVRSVGIGSFNMCEVSLNEDIQGLIPNFEECEERISAENIARYSCKGTSTENYETHTTELRIEGANINANSVTIHNYFYGRKSGL